MAVELAAAYVSLVPSTKGISKQLTKELGGPLADVSAKAGVNAGKGFATNLATNASKSLDKMGGKIVSGLGTAFKVGAGAVAAGIATSIGLGLQRLVGIDEAEGKLRGLGHTTAGIATIMDSALASVRGTAFGLAEAATTAAGAVAAGIKPGEELTKYLTLTADAATIAGISMDEMGSIVNKVTTSGKAMTDNLNQLADRGIPIFQWLQEEYDVTAVELSKMVSSGKVDAETFRRVIEENIGGAALESGNTVSGSFANMKAAMGRWGAAVVGPIFGQATTFFGGVTAWIDGLTDRTKVFVDAFAQGWQNGASAAGRAVSEIIGGTTNVAANLRGMFEQVSELVQGTVGTAFETVAGLVRDALGWYRENADLVGRVASAVGPVAAGLSGLGVAIHAVTVAWAVLRAATPVGLLLALVSGLTYAWQNSERFRDIVTSAFESVRSVVAPIVETVGGLLGGLAARFEAGGGLSGALERVRGIFDTVTSAFREGGAIFEWVADLWASLKPRFDAIGQSFSGIASTLAPVVSWIGERLPGAFQALWSIAGPIVRFLVGLIGDTLKMAIDGVVQVFQGAVKVIEGVLNVFAGLFTGNWSRLWEGVKQIGQGIWNAIVGLVRTWLAVSVMKVITAPIKAIVRVFQTGWQSIRGFFTKGADDAVGIVSRFGQAIRNLFTQARDAVVNTVRGWIETIYLRFLYMRDAVAGVVRGAWETIRTIFTGGTSFINTVVRAAFNLVRTTIGNAMTAVRTAVSNGIRNVMTLFRQMPGNIVRALGRLVRMLYNAGKDAILGFINGIKSQARAVIGAISSTITDALPGFVKKALGIASPSKVFAELGADTIEGFVQGIERTSAGPVDAVSSMVAEMGEAARRSKASVGTALKALSSEVGQSARGIVGNLKLTAEQVWQLVDAAADARQQLADDAAQLAEQWRGKVADITKSADELAGRFGAAVGSLASLLGRARARTIAEAGLAVEQLESLAGQVEAFAGRVASAFGSATSLVGEFGSAEAVERGDVTGFLNRQVDAAKNWSRNLAALARAGLDQGLLQELAEAGPKAAPLVAGLLDEVAAGNLKAINRAQRDLRRVLDNTIRDVGRVLEPAWREGEKVGTSIADGIGAGIVARSPGLQAEIRKLVQSLVQAAKDELGIKSPSRVFAAIGADAMRGFALGWDSTPARLSMDRFVRPAVHAYAPAGGDGASTPTPGPLALDEDTLERLAQLVNDGARLADGATAREMLWASRQGTRR